MTNINKSKTLSYILRHKPEEFSLKMDEFGWVLVKPLLTAVGITQEELDTIVTDDKKGRYQYSLNKQSIRATQGHSRSVILDLENLLEVFTPVYHGTSKAALTNIFENGLIPGSRQHVHMCYDLEQAKQTGGRHGKPVVLVIDVNTAIKDGVKFHKSSNGYVLSEHVPAKYVAIL